MKKIPITLVLTRKARKRMKSLDKKDNIPFDKACDLAGWDDESKL
jgi:hypothetical protein